MTPSDINYPFIVSAADIGTNTVKTTHASIQNDGSLTALHESADTIRLGKGIEETGAVEIERIEACLATLKEEEAIGRKLGSSTFIGVATEALRVATNGHELLTRIAAETSWQVDLITGDQEARLTYIGLQDYLPNGGSSMIVDIGGGSTEIIHVVDMSVATSLSIPLGSGRLADACFRTDPPGIEALMEATSRAMSRLDDLSFLPDEGDALLFAGGNGVFIQHLVEQLSPGEALAESTVEKLLMHLASAPAQDTADRIGISHERARVLPAGVAIAFAFLLKAHFSSVAGVPSGIRTGLIKDFVNQNR